VSPVRVCTSLDVAEDGDPGLRVSGKRGRARRLPLKDVAAAGGWKDVTTLLTCYQHAHEATMLKVMESPVRLVSRRAAGALEKR
jgi:hypothetical protein